MNWKRIFENVLIIFFATIPATLGCFVLCFVLLAGNMSAADSLGDYQEIVQRQDEQIYTQKEEVKEQAEQIEILRTQLSQCEKLINGEL